MTVADPREDFAEQTGRLADRVRSLALTRLARPLVEGGPTRADLVHSLAADLAVLGAQVEGALSRPLPRESDAVVGDQVAVCATDVLLAAGGGELDPVVAQSIANAAAAARALRLVL